MKILQLTLSHTICPFKYGNVRNYRQLIWKQIITACFLANLKKGFLVKIMSTRKQMTPLQISENGHWPGLPDCVEEVKEQVYHFVIGRFLFLNFCSDWNSLSSMRNFFIVCLTEVSPLPSKVV